MGHSYGMKSWGYKRRFDTDSVTYAIYEHKGNLMMEAFPICILQVRPTATQEEILELRRKARLIAAAPDMRESLHPGLLRDIADRIESQYPLEARWLRRTANQQGAAVGKADKGVP